MPYTYMRERRRRRGSRRRTSPSLGMEMEETNKLKELIVAFLDFKQDYVLDNLY